MLAKNVLSKAPLRRNNATIGPGITRSSLYDTPAIQRSWLRSVRRQGLLRKSHQRPKQIGTRPRREGGLAELQQRYGDHDVSQRAGNLHSPPSDYLPFEGLDEDNFETPTSTITPKERRVFETLINARGSRAAATPSPSDAKSSKGSAQRGRKASSLLDEILHSSVQKIKALQRGRNSKQQQATPSTQDEALKKNIVSDRNRVNDLMEGAATDVKLHRILQNHVLDRLAALHSDADVSSSKSSSSKTPARQTNDTLTRTSTSSPSNSLRPKQEATDFAILTSNLPTHLLTYMRLSQAHFPSSSLPLTLLPTLHSLGPAAFALGVSTALYNAHLSIHYHHHPTAILALADILEEMDRLVYPFDANTSVFIDRVLRDCARYRVGAEGEAVKAVWSTEQVTRGVKALIYWKTIVQERREEDALRQARETVPQ